MSLKTATVLAIIGASLTIVLGVIGLIARFLPSLAGVVFVGRRVVFAALHMAVSVMYLLFFITLHGKQK